MRKGWKNALGVVGLAAVLGGASMLVGYIYRWEGESLIAATGSVVVDEPDPAKFVEHQAQLVKLGLPPWQYKFWREAEMGVARRKAQEPKLDATYRESWKWMERGLELLLVAAVGLGLTLLWALVLAGVRALARAAREGSGRP
jgi:hypothetical protein